MQPKSPFIRWLLLSLAVLLAHLGLLESIPPTLNLASGLNDPAMTFSTRAIPPPLDLAPAPLMPTTIIAAKPKSPAPRKTTPEPAPPTPDNVDTSAQQAGDAVGGLGGEAEQMAAAQAAIPASAPEPLAPKEPAPVARPPREKPPSFSLDTLSGSARLVYKVNANKFPFSLNAELLWRNLGETYNARLSYSAFGQSRSQTSRGLITDIGLAPERFTDKYRSEVAAHFNYAQAKVTFSANTPDVSLLNGAQDRLSVLVQLSALVASEPKRYGPGTTLTIQTVGPRDADLWLFSFEAMEILELPGGSLQGLKLERNPRQPYDQKVEVWLAPKLGYLPARIRITETNGDSIDQQWVSSESAEDTD